MKISALWKNLFVLILTLLALLQVNLAAASNYNIPITGVTDNPAFDQRFINFMRVWRVPGASVTVMRDNQILLSRGYGWADVQTKTPVTPDSLFRIGSVSKTITAVTVLRLIEAQKLSLDDHAFQVLNNLSPLREVYNPSIYNITIRNLLQMSSGWYTDYMDPMFGPWSMRMLDQLTGMTGEMPPNCQTAARMMMSIPLQFRPGTQFSYSNINYCLLGLIANKVNGLPLDYQNYESYVQQNVLAPIGVTSMRIGDTLPQFRAPNEVTYYSYPGMATTADDLDSRLTRTDGLPYSNSQILKKNFSDGGWIASSVDLAKFLQGLQHHTLLSAHMVDEMIAKPDYARRDDNYFAMGWNVVRAYGHLYYMKTGSFTGTYAFIMQSDDGTSYVALFNTKPPERMNLSTNYDGCW